MNVTNEMRSSVTSEYTHSASSSGSNRRHKKNSLWELEEEGIPLVGHTSAFNSSTLEINVENSSATGSDHSSSSTNNTSNTASGVKVKSNLIQV